MRKFSGIFLAIMGAFISFSMINTLGCDGNEIDPCDAVGLNSSYMVYIIDCDDESSTTITNAQYDYEFGWLLYYDFSISCGDEHYGGNVTINRDSGGNVLSIQKVVNGQVCY